MNHRILAALCASALIAGSAHATDASSGTPQYGSWGFDLAGVDMATKPGDKFFRYANDVSDPHSPRVFRVNGVVRNIDAGYDMFAVKPGDKLYVAPAMDSCIAW